MISGGPGLLCSHFKKTDPLSISLYFPETTIGEIETETAVGPDHPYISSIRTSQLSASGKTAKILISLKHDVAYDVKTGDDGMTVTIDAGLATSDQVILSANASEDKDEAEVGGNDATEIVAAEVGSAIETTPLPIVYPESTAMSVASVLEGVDANPNSDATDISLFADGAIEDYSTFTISDPPRIVFDIHQISSDYAGLQKIVVDSPHVKTVRHLSYPGKIRLVVDTHEAFLNQFTSKPVANGLLISVGAAAPLEETPLAQTVADVSDKPDAASNQESDRTAWLNKIEFSSEDEGESNVVIGTTSEVRYETEKISDREIQLKLFKTRVPEYRKRPLITTRFNSAVDRVTPVQTAKMGDMAVVNIELRESVDYKVVKEGNFIKVSFAASAIPPKPLEQTKRPVWQQILEGETVSGQEEITVTTDAGGTEPAKVSETIEVRKVDPQTGEVYVEKQDTLISDAFDLQQQVRTRTDEMTGEEIPVDIYQTQLLKRYTGEKIALNFYETDIKNVFRILGEVSQQNFAIDKDVTGRVTLNFEKPVPWDQVLDLVLKMNGLGQTLEGDIIRIATQETLAQEEAARRKKLAEKQAREDQEDLVTIFLRMSYIDAEETARDHLVGNPEDPKGKWVSKFNPDRGKVSVDPKQNMIVVTDIPRSIKRAKEIVTKLDKVTPQVLIEARIVETTTEFTQELGFDWGQVSIGQFDLGDWGSITGIDLVTNNSINSTPTGSLSFGFSKLTGTSFDIVDATLEVFERQGQTKTISSPKVLTLDGKEATISQGFEIPYEERDSAGGSSIAFKDALLELKIKPQVTPDDRISLFLQLTRNDVLDITRENPPLTTNYVETELLIEDGETIVIGGIITAALDEGEEGIPGLMHIPMLGYLFKVESKRDQQTELLIFLTPKVVKLDQKEIF
ncbi:MAG: type IV pilus secretin PilQ [Desulfobacterales bacterium]